MRRVRTTLKRDSSPKIAIEQGTGPLKAILQYAAVPLSLATALLYLFGYIYYGSYLSWWGLPENLFPLSKDQSIISGLFRTLVLSFTMLPKLVLFMVLLLAVMITTIVSTYRPAVEWLSNPFSCCKSRAVSVLRNNVSITPVHDKLMDTMALITGGICILVLVLGFIAYSFLLVSGQAKKQASKEYADILTGKEGNGHFSSRANLLVNNGSKTFDIYSGHLIQTSTSHAALYTRNRGIMIFPMATVARIELSEAGTNTKK